MSGHVAISVVDKPLKQSNGAKRWRTALQIAVFGRRALFPIDALRRGVGEQRDVALARAGEKRVARLRRRVAWQRQRHCLNVHVHLVLEDDEALEEERLALLRAKVVADRALVALALAPARLAHVADRLHVVHGDNQQVIVDEPALGERHVGLVRHAHDQVFLDVGALEAEPARARRLRDASALVRVPATARAAAPAAGAVLHVVRRPAAIRRRRRRGRRALGAGALLAALDKTHRRRLQAGRRGGGAAAAAARRRRPGWRRCGDDKRRVGGVGRALVDGDVVHGVDWRDVDGVNKLLLAGIVDGRELDEAGNVRAAVVVERGAIGVSMVSPRRANNRRAVAPKLSATSRSAPAARQRTHDG
jgi:hypothetical protein